MTGYHRQIGVPSFKVSPVFYLSVFMGFSVIVVITLKIRISCNVTSFTVLPIEIFSHKVRGYTPSEDILEATDDLNKYFLREFTSY